MTDSDGPSDSDELIGSPPNARDPARDVLSFVCVLPCTNPPVKYLNQLNGCANGIHFTREETKDMSALVDRMVNAIVANREPSVGEETAAPCVVCLDGIAPSQTLPMLYMENCPHYFHNGCVHEWRNTRMNCPHYRVVSIRAILSPQLFSTATAKYEFFQLQKCSFGLDVTPQTLVQVLKYSIVNGFPAFDLAVRIGLEWKYLKVRKRRSPRPLPRDTPSPFGGHTLRALQNKLSSFAHKVAKHIMTPVAIPEHLVCAFCNKTSEPNSVWLHMQNCVHCLHVDCVALVRLNNSNPTRKLDLCCPTCHVTSVRTMAWPGQFPSEMVKDSLFVRQLAEFKLKIHADTPLAIVEVAIGNWLLDGQMNIFTVDYGGPNVVIIDADTARDNSTIWYD